MRKWSSRALLLTCSVLLAGTVTDARANRKIDFESFSSGDVIAGLEPDGSINPGTTIPSIKLSAFNNSGGPHSLLVFDSQNPTGDDFDIGTPNQTCAGAGVGSGGETGQPGENCQSLGNVLIIAENLVDSNLDTLVDDPDDERTGGRITVEFIYRVAFVSCTVVDIDHDEPGGNVQLWDGQTLVSQQPLATLGSNSIQTLPFGQMGDRVVINLPSSGAVGEFLFDESMPVESTSWGKVKTLYR